MTAKERYYWDLTGYLVLRDVFPQADVEAANEAIDYLGEVVQSDDKSSEVELLRQRSRPSIENGILTRTTNSYPFLLTLPAPHCEPFRKMIALPAIVSRLNVMCGKGFRLDHGPQFIGGINGTKGGNLHGAGEPHREAVAYHHQNGKAYVGGVTVTFQLGESPTGSGGFACVPGSHKAKYPMPAGVRSQEDEMGAVAEPDLHPGDVLFFMDGAQTHGTHPWTADFERRSILIKYASRTATRSGISQPIAPPETYWDDEIVAGMTEEQRAVMYGPYSNTGAHALSLDIGEDGVVYLEK